MLRPFLASCLLLLSGLAHAADLQLCEELVVRCEQRLTFNTTERRFLCGDPGNEPWTAPTEGQTRLFLAAFLQTRGYFQPQFRREGKVLVVDVGSRTRIKALQSEGAPPELDISRFWVPKRKPLSPELLDEYEGLVRGRLQAKGYPCPTVEAKADAIDGTMLLEAEPGPRQKVARIEDTEDRALRPGTLRRYFPFEEGDWFDGDLVFIANERIKAADILTSSYMMSTCGARGALVHHRGSAGLPRRMTVGAGVDTETYFLLRSTYRNARVDANASSFDAIFSVNYFRQRLQSGFNWHFLSTPSSLHFKPSLAVHRINEKSSEQQATVASWHLGAYHDVGNEYVRAYVGPNLNHVRTVRGKGPAYARILEMELSGRIMSHAYEFYRGAPRTGHVLDWRYTTASAHRLSTMAVKTYAAKGEILFNVANLEPPLLVIGLRGNVASTAAPIDAELPDQYFYFIGGSDDVRGFRRRTVPSATPEARSVASVGTELRLVTVIPNAIQPFLLLDFGRIGRRTFLDDPTVFYSPGAGARWQSPIGSLRATVARGLTRRLPIKEGAPSSDYEPRWTAFLSFGEEF